MFMVSRVYGLYLFGLSLMVDGFGFWVSGFGLTVRERVRESVAVRMRRLNKI